MWCRRSLLSSLTRRLGLVLGLTGGLILAAGIGLGFAQQTFTDDPLVARATPVKVLHVTELRTAINGLRTRFGLAAFTFTDPTLTARSTPIGAVHVTELRAALAAVYQAAGQTPPGYTDASIVARQTIVKAAHLTELRAAVRTAQQFTFSLSLARSGTGSGSVTSSPAGIACGTTCTAPFAPGTPLTLTASPAAGSTFAGWSGGGCSGTGTCTVSMNANTTITATFNIQTFTLSVTKAGPGSGPVTSSPAGINCGGTCSASFNSGTSVTLTATPSSGSVFAGWSGGGCSGTGTCGVTVTANTTVTATFNQSSGLVITALSLTSAAPAQLLTITGSGFDTTARVSVRFTDAQGRTVEVPAVQVTTTTIDVPVPPFVDPVSGLMVTGVVNVRVVKETSSSTTTSNVISGFQILGVSTSALPDGAVTLAFLSAARVQAFALQSEVLAASVEAALGPQMDNLGPLILNIQTVIDNPSATFTIGSIRGTPITIGAAQLRAVDQMLIAMFQALAQPGAGGAASFGSPPMTAQASTSTSGCLQDEGGAAAQGATQGDAALDALVRPVVYAPRTSVRCAFPNAFNTAYRIVVGGGTVAIGIMALAGASPMALSLSAAALLYVTVVGGGGEIAIGGALNQTTAAAGQLVQQGVARLDGVLQDLLIGFVLPDTVGDIVDIFQGTNDLSDAFTQSPLPLPSLPPQPLPDDVQCCVGTNGCPGETGTDCGAACCCCGLGARCCPDLSGCCGVGASLSGDAPASSVEGAVPSSCIGVGRPKRK